MQRAQIVPDAPIAKLLALGGDAGRRLASSGKAGHADAAPALCTVAEARPDTRCPCVGVQTALTLSIILFDRVTADNIFAPLWLCRVTGPSGRMHEV